MLRNNKITTVLFDFDGTLADTMGILIKIINDSLVMVRNPIDSQQLTSVNDQLKSQVSNESFKQGRLIIIRFLFYYAGRVGLNKRQTIRFVFICLSKLRRFYKTAVLYPDVPVVLERLKKAGYTLGIVTTASKKNIQQLLTKPYSQYFDSIITREMVTKLKPSPEGLNKALMQLQRKPQESIYVGDLPHDILAGHQAGMLVVALENNFVSKEVLGKYTPDMICSSLTEASEWIIQYNRRS